MRLANPIYKDTEQMHILTDRIQKKERRHLWVLKILGTRYIR